MTDVDTEFVRLRALTVTQAARIHELEDALARCIRKGIELRAVLQYYDDAPKVN